MLTCPNCQGHNIIKNGSTYYGKQNHKCKGCGRQFVKNNTHTVSSQKRKLAKRALNERLSMRAICRIVEVSFNWLAGFSWSVWDETPDDLGVPKNLRLSSHNPIKINLLQADEMWSFVGEKKNKRWIWVAYAPSAKQVVAVHFGDRSEASAWALWSKIPKHLRQKCVFETDHWDAHKKIIPRVQHKVGKDLTYFIEGLFTGVRARVSRLVRKSLSFSKKVEAHDAAIRYYFWQFNLRNHPYI